MNFKNIILSCLATCFSLVAMAQDYSLSIQATTDKEDKGKAVLDVFMTNKETVSAIQFDITLSENTDVFYGKNVDGDMAYIISKGDRAKTSHALSYKKLSDRTYRVVIASPKNDTFKETEENKVKPVASFTLDINNVTKGAMVKTEIRNIVLSHYETNTGSVDMLYPQDVTYEFETKTQVPADVNGDDKVNVEDVNAVISVICGVNTYADKGDVNGDGKVDINDVNAVINIICGDK